MPVATLTDAQSAALRHVRQVALRDRPAALAVIAGRHGLALRFHPGFVLPVDAVDADFRGPDIPPLAARVHAEFARPGQPLHAEVIGRAAASVVREPQRWADRGPAAVTLQHLKHLWHVLVWFGVTA
ncbi:DUF3626 domain-containing protein [Micromonospora chalcea]|uniref:DUF3626 domain-containing protein n=1 Tax=Micromonospora chalcea TaxID=1874 RepID=UPI00216A5CB8|nr:DUF3626 domain-containing protein [Micromonospora chalcea]